MLNTLVLIFATIRKNVGMKGYQAIGKWYLRQP